MRHGLPEKIGNYRLIGELGAGGMGEVFLAEDLELHRRVALKLIAHRVESAITRARLRREARAIAALNHPNIVTIYQISEHEGRTFLVMEYVDGEPLTHLIEEGPASVAQALDAVIQICEGLREAHAAGIVHRDVKPDNALIDRRGRVKLLDFGLAKSQRSLRLTGDHAMIGTAAYMSPEQTLNREADARSDVFSCGVLFYELLTGQQPFQGSGPMGVLYAIASQPPAPWPEHLEIPAGVRAIVERALEKEPERRYQSVDEMLADLYRERGSSGAGSSGFASSGGSFAVPLAPHRRRWLEGAGTPRRWWTAAAVAALFVLLLVAGAVWWRSGNSADARREAGSAPAAGPAAIAVLPFAVRGGGEHDYLGDGVVELLSTKLDGAGDLRSVDPRALLGYMTRRQLDPGDPRLGEQAARHFRARYYTRGTIVAAGDQIHLSAELYDVGAPAGAQPGSRLAQVEVEGPASELLDLLDTLTARLLEELLGGPGTRLQRLAVATSSSLPALKAYLRGEGEFRAGRFEEALAAYQEAVTADPDFALAHYRICVAADWLARGDLSGEASAAAARLSHRLNDHDRLLLEAMLAWRSGRAREAERQYRVIVGTFDDDVEAWFQLGEVLFHYGPRQGQSLAASRSAFEKVLALEPEHVPALWHLARVASVEGRLDELRQLVDRVEALQPGGDRLTEIRALRAFAIGDGAERARALQELDAAHDLTLAIASWNVAVFSSELAGAEAVTALLAGEDRSLEMQALGRVVAAHLRLAAGRWQDARTLLAAAARADTTVATEYFAALALAPFRTPTDAELRGVRAMLLEIEPEAVVDNTTPNVFLSVHNGMHALLRDDLLARLEARLGNGAEALGLAEGLAGVSTRPESETLAEDLRRGVRAAVAADRAGAESALQILGDGYPSDVWYGWTTVSPFFSRSHERYLRAGWLAEVGRSEEAIVAYASFAEHSLYDLIYVAPSHFRRAEIYERLGQPGRAAEHYLAFVKAWRSCDPELRPWVRTAEERLSALSAP